MGSKKGFTLIEACVVVVIICILIFGLGSGFMVNDNKTINAVEKQGYSNVVIIQKHCLFPYFFGGGSGDVAVYNMNATNPAGRRNIDIIVGAGWLFKGVTVRTK
jgi:prepilin-type N-terminal cleavage/methylation domain-containing protein